MCGDLLWDRVAWESFAVAALCACHVGGIRHVAQGMALLCLALRCVALLCLRRCRVVTKAWSRCFLSAPCC